MRTPLTFYGGKQKLASEIIAHMPEHYAYLEPFAGGAAVLFAKPRAQRETLNDLDETVMRFWRALRERPDELAEAVFLTPYSRQEWLKSRAEATTDDVEAARRLLVNVDQSFSRSRESFSPPSILRERRGRWQPSTWANLPEKLVRAAQRLQGVCLEHGDALEMIPRFDLPETVIYADPPYAGEHRLTAHGYQHDAGDDLWRELIPILANVTEAMVLLSGYPNEHTSELVANDWREVTLKHRRHVAARSANGVRAGSLGLCPETLWLSPNVPAQTDTLFDSHERGVFR